MTVAAPKQPRSLPPQHARTAALLHRWVWLLLLWPQQGRLRWRLWPWLRLPCASGPDPLAVLMSKTNPNENGRRRHPCPSKAWNTNTPTASVELSLLSARAPCMFPRWKDILRVSPTPPLAPVFPVVLKLPAVFVRAPCALLVGCRPRVFPPPVWLHACYMTTDERACSRGRGEGGRGRKERSCCCSTACGSSSSREHAGMKANKRNQGWDCRQLAR